MDQNNSVKRSKRGKNNRSKGHALEREVVSIFRDVLGFKYCKTSRATSKLLDDCGVDISLTGPMVESNPLLIQCKMGYKRARPKADVEFRKIRDALLEHFPEDHTIHKVPKMLIHKLDGRAEENFLVTVTMNDFLRLTNLHTQNGFGCTTETAPSA